MILKCKMCGGDISVNADMTVGTCNYCGSTMTLPRVDSEKKIRLFNHANQYRLNCEFDKAYDAYKLIAAEDEQESEAYWGMILSEYGVEYVEDPSTNKRIPTCHRTLVKPVKSNTNYELAYKYADAERKLVYLDEADELDRIQKSILSVSSKEKPYDIFICYKETDDESGDRTVESVAAQEVYDELTRNGYKVFFSRITLADKLGKDYEPYIYSALKTAKIMLVIGSSAANINSTWVKNEWSRFLQFMQEDDQKIIIPVYKNMEAYEMPSELNRFQGQDLNKIGAVQDLVFSVKKIINTETLLKRDDALNQIIAERELAKRRQLENARKGKKALKILGIIGCTLVVFALVISIVKFFLDKRDHDIDLAERSNIISTEIPDNTQYNYFIVDLNDDNFLDYFEPIRYGDGNASDWCLHSLAYDKGWILYNCEEFSGEYKYNIIGRVYKGSFTGDPVNADITFDNTPRFNRNYKFSNCTGRLYYVSKNALERCEFVNGVRTISLKNQKAKEPLENFPDAKNGTVTEGIYW